jgi:hypothetical protein
MATQILRVQDEIYKEIRELSELEGLPMAHLVAKAVEEYKRARFFDDLDAAFSRLKADPAAWAEEQEERAQSEKTLLDGLTRD